MASTNFNDHHVSCIPCATRLKSHKLTGPCVKDPKISNSFQISYKTKVLTSFDSESKLQISDNYPE